MIYYTSYNVYLPDDARYQCYYFLASVYVVLFDKRALSKIIDKYSTAIAFLLIICISFDLKLSMQIMVDNNSLTRNHWLS